MNKKKILQVMHEFNLKPPRLWYQKKYIAGTQPEFQNRYTNLVKDPRITEYTLGDLWSSDLTYIKFKACSSLWQSSGISLPDCCLQYWQSHHDADLILKTLKEAVVKTGKPRRYFPVTGDGNFVCTVYQFSEHPKVQISSCDPGSPSGNTWSESFFPDSKWNLEVSNQFCSFGELLENIFFHTISTTRIQTRLKMSPYLVSCKILQKVFLKNRVPDTNPSETRSALALLHTIPKMLDHLGSPHSTIRYFLILSSCVLLSLHQNYNP